MDTPELSDLMYQVGVWEVSILQCKWRLARDSGCQEGLATASTDLYRSTPRRSQPENKTYLGVLFHLPFRQTLLAAPMMATEVKSMTPQHPMLSPGDTWKLPTTVTWKLSLNSPSLKIG